MQIPLSPRVERIKPSPTLAVSARVAKMQAAGQDIINLGVGEPDFDTPEHIKEAAIRAIQDGFTKYTAVDGIPSLKQAIAKKFAQENQLNYEPSQILVSCGCKQSFYNLAQALLKAGDEVIIPAPYWVSYPDMVLLADATPVFIDAGFEQRFKITAQQLKLAITPKTRLVVLNSPSNPSGMMYTRKELLEIAAVLVQNPHVFIVSDDMYEHILWTKEPFANILNVCPELYSRTIVLNGVSKAYAMTGWRIGYAAGPQPIIAAMTKIQSQSTSNPASISQIAAQVALDSDQTTVRSMCKAFKERHDVLYHGLKALPGVKCHPSDGTFYTFPDVSAVIEKIPNMASDIDFADYLLNHTGIAIVPGTAFGTPGCIRFSFATSLEILQDALQRLTKVIT